MLEPQSIWLFLLLVALFAGLVWWSVAARRVPLRVLAACLAFLPAMAFGIVSVNRYYGYYQTWGAAISDLTAPAVQATGVAQALAGHGTGLQTFGRQPIDEALARQNGFTAVITVHGRSSGITRPVLVYLPPQYFWPGHYQQYRFPVIELMHGFPGAPQDWISVLGVDAVLSRLVAQGKADPAVLVMPAINGPPGVMLQCLNQAGGPQDATFLTADLVRYITGHFRVAPPGLGWGLAGYSEGGFCAANLGLQHGEIYNYAGVMSGYFTPSFNRLANPDRTVSPFGGNRHLRSENTPLDLVRTRAPGRPLPQFWLGAGLLDRADVAAAERFAQLLQLRQPAVTVHLIPGAGHTAPAWRQMLGPMLTWMTRGLAQIAAEKRTLLAEQHSHQAGQHARRSAGARTAAAGARRARGG